MKEVTRTDTGFLTQQGEAITFHGAFISIKKNDDFEAFPTGHFARNPLQIDKNGEWVERISALDHWLNEPFRKCVIEKPVTKAAYQAEGQVSSKKAILINCLDTCYGHSLYKLFNANFHFQADPSICIVAIVHESLAYLVPEYVEGKWIVSAPISSLGFHLDGFHDFVHQQTASIGQLYISDAYLNLNLDHIDITSFTKVSPFPFKHLSKGPFTIGIVLREDRYWLRSTFMSWLYLAYRKRHNTLLQKILFRAQKRNLQALRKNIMKSLDDVTFLTFGLGNDGKLPGWQDLRETYDEYIHHEQSRCEAYARCHLIIGIDGSNMLLPSYLAGGYISLLPDFQVPVYGESYLPKKDTPKQRDLFLSRNLPATISPKALALQATEMIKGSQSHGEKIN